MRPQDQKVPLFTRQKKSLEELYPRGTHKKKQQIIHLQPLFPSALPILRNSKCARLLSASQQKSWEGLQDGAGHFSHKKERNSCRVILTFMEISRLFRGRQEESFYILVWGSSSSHLRDNQFQYFRQPQRILYEGTSPIAFHSITYFLCFEFHVLCSHFPLKTSCLSYQIYTYFQHLFEVSPFSRIVAV